MIDDRRVVVIGSGPCGAIAAKTLVDRGIPVTMLESGTRFPGGFLVRAADRDLFRWTPRRQNQRRHVSHGDQDVQWTQELVAGGLSNYWHGAVPRFAPEDFTEGDRLDDRYRWPIRYDDLLPYYERVERLIGVAGGRSSVRALPASHITRHRRLPNDWTPIAESAARLGRNLTPMPTADGSAWLIRRSATSFNSFERIVRPLLRSSLFDLTCGAHVLKLETRTDKSAMDSVVYYDKKEQREGCIQAQAIVIAAGALSSTKLLLDSNSATFPAGLGNTEGLLGKYLHDHVHDMCFLRLNKPMSRLQHPAYLTRRSYSRSAPLIAAQATIGTNASRAHNVLRFTNVPVRHCGINIFGTMIPTEDNFVVPDGVAKDAFGLPMLNISIKFRPEEVTNMADLKQEIVSIFEASGYAAKIDWSLPEIKPGTSVHYGGTIRMHESSQYGMLDQWNRLYSMPNVIVADASCFTTCVEKNPTLTAMAIAARAADRLAYDLKTNSVTRGTVIQQATRSELLTGRVAMSESRRA